MDNYVVLIIVGFLIGSLGTIIGAGGGFLLVPLLIIIHPELSPEIITAISIAIVGCNAISGSVAYARLKRIDYKAGLLFAAFTIPGSIAGVYTTQYIPKTIFNIFFGILLIVLAFFLFIKKTSPVSQPVLSVERKNWKTHLLTDKEGTTYQYSYNQHIGIFISIIVGYLSPILGIGGGIIHVPALINLLRFPVMIATATSHFILAIMATVSVIVHLANGNYSDPYVLRMVIGLSTGVIAGAQLGALLSHKIHGNIIIRVLAICLGLAGLRILLTIF
ncbi:MAG: sulfite exporter TauE/SafE family protein [Chitinophagaceae bacterium]